MASVVLVSPSGVEHVVSTTRAFVSLVYARGYLPTVGTVEQNYAVLAEDASAPTGDGSGELVRVVDIKNATSNARLALNDYYLLKEDYAGGGGGVATTDARLTDARTPKDSSVTNIKVAADANISADKLADGTAKKVMTSAERTKLGGIAASATANAADAALRDRASHTGFQPMSSVEGLVDALNNAGAGEAYTDKKAQLAAANMIAAGTHVGISYTYDGVNNKLSSSVTGGGGSSSAPATLVRLLAPDNGIYDVTVASDGALVTTSVPRESLGAQNDIQLSSGSKTFSIAVAADGVLTFAEIVSP